MLVNISLENENITSTKYIFQNNIQQKQIMTPPHQNIVLTRSFKIYNIGAQASSDMRNDLDIEHLQKIEI